MLIKWRIHDNGTEKNVHIRLKTNVEISQV